MQGSNYGEFQTFGAGSTRLHAQPQIPHLSATAVSLRPRALSFRLRLKRADFNHESILARRSASSPTLSLDPNPKALWLPL